MGNPGDYVWGRDGLDAIVTQLLNQMDGTGPPPLPRKQIDEIPTTTISQSQVGQYLQHMLISFELYVFRDTFFFSIIF